MLVVAVFSSGWQLMLSWCMSSASTTRRTRRSGSLMRAKAVTDPGRHAQRLHQKLRLAEAETARAQCPRQRLEVDPRGALGDDKEQLPALVLEEEVLGMGAGKLPLELAALRYRKQRLVLDRVRHNLQVGEAAEQVLAGCGAGRWHWLSHGKGWPYLAACRSIANPAVPPAGPSLVAGVLAGGWPRR